MIEVLEEDLSTERKRKLESIAFSTNPILSATPLIILKGKKAHYFLQFRLLLKYT